MEADFLPRDPALAGAVLRVLEEHGWAFGGPDAVPEVVRASISRFADWPQRLEIAAGTVVEWVNEDRARHTVTAADAFGSGGLAPGERWRARFDEPGTYLDQCAMHPFMQAVVVVPIGARARNKR